MAQMPASMPMAGDDPMAPAAPDMAEDAGPTVLLTVMSNGDGTYTLIEGDEPDETAAEPPVGIPGAEGVTATAEPGQTFDSPGALLKGILDLVTKSEEGNSAEDNFDAGFKGGTDASPPKPPKMEQKY